MERGPLFLKVEFGFSMEGERRRTAQQSRNTEPLPNEKDSFFRAPRHTQRNTQEYDPGKAT
eukprot:1975724-Pyramimonas_sp.AAC.1